MKTINALAFALLAGSGLTVGAAPPGEGAKVLPFRRPRVWAAAGALLTASCQELLS